MKLTCEKQILLTAITTSLKAVSNKSSVACLDGLLLEAKNDTLKIIGYDLKKGIITSIDAAISKEGSIVLNAKLLVDIVRKMPDGELSVSVDQKFIATISSGKTILDILGAAPTDYPELPSIEGGKKITLKDTMLKSMITDTIFAISDNEAHPVYTGALFESAEGVLTVAAIDGYRLAVRKEKLSRKNFPEFKFIIPKNTLNNLESILPGTEANVTITHNEKHICFSMEHFTLISRKLEGEFMDYRNTVPQDLKYKVTADKTDLIPSLDRVSLVIGDTNAQPVRCVFNDSILNLYTASSLGKANDECILEGNCEGLEIGFNSRYIFETLRSVPSDDIILSLESSTKPCVITPADKTDKFIYMVLPVRLKAG